MIWQTPALILSFTVGLQSVAVCSPSPSPSTSAPPTWLSAKQFVDVKFPESLDRMMPGAREQLKATFPKARSDIGPINWDTAKFAIERKGKPTISYYISNWALDGTLPLQPAFSPIAAEALFNCTDQDEIHKLTSSAVHTSEQETTKTQKKETTNRVKTNVKVDTKASFQIGYVNAEVGGEFAKEWEKTVMNSTEFVTRTKTSLVHSVGDATDITVSKLSLRFQLYTLRSQTERYIVSGGAIIDVPLRAAFTRPQIGIIAAKKFAFDLGLWSNYSTPEERTIQQKALVTIPRETVVSGPTQVKFANAGQCFEARQKLESNGTDIPSLIKSVEDLNPVSLPTD